MFQVTAADPVHPIYPTYMSEFSSTPIFEIHFITQSDLFCLLFRALVVQVECQSCILTNRPSILRQEQRIAEMPLILKVPRTVQNARRNSDVAANNIGK
jgi:hypothetical protein